MTYLPEDVIVSSGLCALQGMCFPCSEGSCPLMGQSANKFNLTSVPAGTKFFLNTGEDEPFGRKYQRMNAVPRYPK